MKPSVILTSIFFSAVLLFATYTQAHKQRDVQTIFSPDSSEIINFINNIISKKEIDKEVVKKNTLIDSVFFCDDCTFHGDSLYSVSDKFLILLLDYSGMNCAYKFLLVYDKNKKANTDYMIGATDCDRDYSAANFHTLTYKVINDSIIKITTHFYHVNSTEENKKRQINDFFSINKEGRFEKHDMK